MSIHKMIDKMKFKLGMNQVFMYTILTLISLYALYQMMNTYKIKEKLSNTDRDKNTGVAKQVYKYFMDNNNIDFVDYINFLTSIKNTNLKIIDLEVFYELKSLKKKGKLTLDSVLNEMSLSDNKTTIKSSALSLFPF
jgi:hypothetical protein